MGEVKFRSHKSTTLYLALKEKPTVRNSNDFTVAYVPPLAFHKATMKCNVVVKYAALLFVYTLFNTGVLVIVVACFTQVSFSVFW